MNVLKLCSLLAFALLVPLAAASDQALLLDAPQAAAKYTQAKQAYQEQLTVYKHAVLGNVASEQKPTASYKNTVDLFVDVAVARIEYAQELLVEAPLSKEQKEQLLSSLQDSREELLKESALLEQASTLAEAQQINAKITQRWNEDTSTTLTLVKQAFLLEKYKAAQLKYTRILHQLYAIESNLEPQQIPIRTKEQFAQAELSLAAAYNELDNAKEDISKGIDAQKNLAQAKDHLIDARTTIITIARTFQEVRS